MRKLLKTLPLGLLGLLCVHAARAVPARDAWAELVGKALGQRPPFAYVENNPALPNVLIYGDSISMGYTLRVRENLKTKANVYRIPRNGGDTGNVIRTMRRMQSAMAAHWTFQWDVIYFNAGLHDIKYVDEKGNLDTANGTQVRSPEDYAQNLKEILAYFNEIAPEATVIFATTTPVPEGARGRNDDDVVRFNAAALAVLEDHPGITVHDLYAFSKSNHESWQAAPGNVHYNEDGRNAQGDEVAKAILAVLP